MEKNGRAAGGSEKRDCAHATAPGEEIWVIKSLFLVSGRNKNCHNTDVFNSMDERVRRRRMRSRPVGVKN